MVNQPIRVAIIGSTGSIGTQVLDVIDASNNRFKVVALCAGKNVKKLDQQIHKYQPIYAGIDHPAFAEKLKQSHDKVTIRCGPEAMEQAATLDEVDLVVVSVVGFAGVIPTLKALAASKKVALANKETLVTAGELVMKKAILGESLVPIDSEHTALFQLLQGKDPRDINLLCITGSGGPFRTTPKEILWSVTPEQALKHPTWNMGGKISIDSATLMNKGLEVIEAFHLFRTDLERLQVIIHPQSRIHGMIELKDGSWLAQLSEPDMRLSIAYSMYYPEVPPLQIKRLNFFELGKLEFAPADTEKFPCLQLAIESVRIGGSMPTALNAANEEAVQAFLQNKISFGHIPVVIEMVMDAHRAEEVTLDNLIETDRWARVQAREFIKDIRQ